MSEETKNSDEKQEKKKIGGGKGFGIVLLIAALVLGGMWISGYSTGMKQNREGVSILQAGITLKGMNSITAHGYKTAIRSNKAFMDHLDSVSE